MRKGIIGIFVVLFLMSLSFPFAFAQPMELKGVSFLPKDHRLCAMIPVWIDKVNVEFKDSIKITWLGGPEVMPPFEQPEAVRNGYPHWEHPSVFGGFDKGLEATEKNI